MGDSGKKVISNEFVKNIAGVGGDVWESAESLEEYYASSQFNACEDFLSLIEVRFVRSHLKKGIGSNRIDGSVVQGIIMIILERCIH